MRYLLKDWGIGGFTSPLDAHAVMLQQQANQPAPAKLPAVVAPRSNRGISDIHEVAREHQHDMIDVFLALAVDTECPPATRAFCAQHVLEWGNGKMGNLPGLPTKSVTINVHGSGDPNDLRQRLARAKEVMKILEDVEEASEDSSSGDTIEAEYTTFEEMKKVS